MQSAPSFWLGRQPILDRSSATVAFELLFRSGGGNTAAVTDNRMATASVISHAFGELGIASVLGDRRGFINFDAELLMSDVVELLPPERTVIEILETVEITTQITERVRALKKRGFSFALDDVVQLDAVHSPLLPFVEVIKIDVLGTPPEALELLVRKARSAAWIRLLAEKVDSREQSELCRNLGFDLFQGYFFAKPTIMRGRRADPSRRQLLRLLEQSLDDGDNAAIEHTFKESPELSYKLMRLVNSVGVAGTRGPIQSLSHALVILGRRQLQRWLQVLLFAHQSDGAFPSPLLQMAAARGKLMELLAARGTADPRWQDRAFLTGILSLLDTLLEMPMASVIEQLRLPGDVRAALLARTGRLGHLLSVVEALERTDDTRVSALLAEGDPCPTSELPVLQIEALSWSNALGQSE
ncbi:MAG TPA: EAL domain-containing protein [Gammaproteobacteria bacterium]|nr:EAL domain-containing protein [Gammaproteobacteria bacterium]